MGLIPSGVGKLKVLPPPPPIFVGLIFNANCSFSVYRNDKCFFGYTPENV